MMAMATGSHQFGNHNWSNSSNDLLLMWTIGSILALNAGMINATTVSESKALSTSPMTGICALVGVSLGRRNWVHFQQSVGILISHILGASLPGYSMPDHLWVRILLGSLILLSASMTNIFSPNSIFFYYFAAMFTGLQNSLTSSTSGNVLRTTHISGCLSDVGLICGRFDDRKYWKVWLYLGLFFSYIGGSLLASWSFNFLQTRQFLVNFSLFTVGGGVFLIIQFCVPIFHPTGDLPSAQSAAAVASSPSPPIAPSSPSHDAGDEQKSNSLSNDDHATSSSSRNTAEVPEVETTGVDLPPDFPWTYVRLQVGTNLLSFHSGFLNATTLLSSPHLYTLQITGNMTLLAIDIIHKRYFDAMIRAIFAMCYFFGSFLMGIIAKSPFFSLDSSYYQIFLIGLALLITAFTTHLLHASSYFYYFLLILFSGYQSAFDCRIHGVLVRTTFMSGTVTDVGTSFGRFLRILFSRSRIDLGILPILFPTIISFIFGSFLATLLYPYASRYQILVNIAIFFTIGVAHTLLVWWYSAEI